MSISSKTPTAEIARGNFKSQLTDWNKKEKAAVSFISCMGKLLYDHGIELVLFRNHLIDESTSAVLNLHDYAKKVVNKPIDIFTTASLAEEILKMDNIKPSKIDIGKLASEWLEEKASHASMKDFISSKLGDLFNSNSNGAITPRDVVLYGFGRIGRLVAREIIKQAGKGQQFHLRAIVTRSNSDADIIKRAALLRMDSVHGPFAGNIVEDLENKALIINGQTVKMIKASAPEDIDYSNYGINNALVIDNTGVYRDIEGLGRHLKSGAISRALLTAPGKGDIPNIVYGVNHKEFDIEANKIFSAASCTTNAIAPILKVIEDNYGIIKGHVETVHAYTNDQNLLDNMHKKHRRGRSAALNMVITETGAGKAVEKAIPSLKGKLTANAVRVPTPNGSLAIMNLTLNKETNLEDLNATLKHAALNGELVNQIRYSMEEELVSNDIIGSTCCSVFDSPATIVHPDGKSVVLYTWYDNEFGYTKQVLRLAKYVCKVRRLIYY